MIVLWKWEGHHSLLRSYLRSAPLLVGQPVVEKNRDKRRKRGFYKQWRCSTRHLLGECGAVWSLLQAATEAQLSEALLVYALATANIHKPVIELLF